MDIWDKEKRSAVMAKIRGKDTKPEWIVRRYLFAHGYRYRKNVKSLPGTPDIVLRKYGLVIFVLLARAWRQPYPAQPHRVLDQQNRSQQEAGSTGQGRTAPHGLERAHDMGMPAQTCRQGTDAERDGISHQPVLFGSPPQKSRTKSTASQEHPSCR